MIVSPDAGAIFGPKGSKNAGAINAVLKQLQDDGTIEQLANENLTATPDNIPVITIK